MLKYRHIFNENLNYPFHIHYLESDTTSIAISLNQVHIGYFKPTKGTKYTFTKYYNIPSTFELLVVGSRQTYDRATNKTYFKDSAAKYIKNNNDDFLCLDHDTSKYYWSSTERSKFYFNPEYFSSKALWIWLIGYIPTGIATLDLFESSLFTDQIYLTDQVWGGQKDIVDVDPVTIDYFDNSVIGSTVSLSVDNFITELQDLKDNDIIKFDTGLETLEVTVKNIYTKATYASSTTTTRPITHVPINIINPNKECLYSKAQSIGDSETINLTLYNNDIQFDIARVAEES